MYTTLSIWIPQSCMSANVSNEQNQGWSTEQLGIEVVDDMFYKSGFTYVATDIAH